MDVGGTHLQDTHHRRRSLQKGRISINGAQAKAARMVKPGDIVQVRKPPVTYSFKVLQPIEKRVGAKLVSEMMENVTTPDQYELLEMSRVSGFVNRAKGTGRPTKKDRRSLEEFTTPEFMDDFDFEFDLTTAKTMNNYCNCN